MICCTIRLSWGPILSAAIAAVWACPCASSAAITLTGINEFSTDNSGNWTGQIWDTRGNINTAYGLWMINGDFGGPFVNGPDMAHAPINVALPNGTYTFSFHGDPGSLSRWGMNLFFNGNNVVPGISVFAQERTNGVVPPFSPNASSNTPSLAGTTSISPTAAANSRSFASNGQAVTITGYQWDAPSINNTDRVSPTSNTMGNGSPDYTGQITLSVYSISSNTWAGFAANDNWSSAGNWTADGHDGVAPAQDGTAHVIFTGSTRPTPNVDLPWNVASIAFDNVSGAFAIGGQPIVVQSGGITNNAVSYGQIINNNINAFQAQTWTAAGAMFFNGSVALGATLTIDGSASTAISGQVSGSGGLIKNGAGTLTLSGGSANIFTGPIVVNAGLVLLDKPDVANATLSGVNSFPGNSLTIGNGSGSAIVRLLAQDQIEDHIATTINAGGVLDINGYSEYMAPIALRGGTIQTGTGFIYLAGLLFNGQTEDILTLVSSTTASIIGRVNLNGAGILNVAVGTTASRIDLDIPAVCYNGRIVKNGAGTLRLSGANTFSGGLTANSGTVVIGSGSNLAPGGYGPVGTGTLTIKNATILSDGVQSRVLENDINLVAGSPGPAFGSLGSLGTAGELLLNSALSGAGGFTVVGGAVDLGGSAANSYSGPTIVNQGFLGLGKYSAHIAVTGSSLVIGIDRFQTADVQEFFYDQLASGMPVTINELSSLTLNNTSGSIGSVTFRGGEIETFSPDSISTGPVTVKADAYSASILGRVNQNSTFTWNVEQGQAPGNPDFDVRAGVFGPGGVIKSGPGMARVSGANTYTGGTVVQGGVFQLGANGAASTGPLSVVGGTFDLNGFNQTVPSLTFGDGSATTAGTVSGAGTLTLNGDLIFNGSPQNKTPPATVASNVSLPSGNHSITTPIYVYSSGYYDVLMSGIIGGNGGLTVAGQQLRVALTRQNNYAGPTTISPLATIFLAATNALPAQTAVTVNGTLALNPSITQTGVTPGNYNQSIGSLAGAGVVELGSATLTVGSDNTNTVFSGTIDSAGGALVKTGTGMLSLTGPSNNIGGTRVAAGALVFNITSVTPTIASGATVTVNAGAVLELAGPISALGSAGGNRARIVNDSFGAAGAAAGLVVSGQQQVVGGIDGSGATQVYAGSHLTADHIIQSALIIGGTSGSGSLVTIAASDASGNPLISPSENVAGLGLTDALQSGESFGAAALDASRRLAWAQSLSDDRSTLNESYSTGGNSSTVAAAVPEPAPLLLAALGLLLAAVTARPLATRSKNAGQCARFSFERRRPDLPKHAASRGNQRL